MSPENLRGSVAKGLNRNLGDSTQYREYSSGRDAVFRFLDENQGLSPKKLMERLSKETVFGGLNYQTVKNYRAQWRVAYSQDGRVPMHHGGRGFLESGFDASLWDAAPCFGWKVSKNKNRERWRYINGISFGWSRNGTVDIRFRGFVYRGCLLGAFSRAFWDVLRSSGRTEAGLADFLKGLFEANYRQVEESITYDVGQPLPRVVIRDRERSHGEVFKLGDGSHPTSLEVECKVPFWALGFERLLANMELELKQSLCQATSDFKATAAVFAENMEKHLTVIDVFKKESEERQKESQARQDALVRIMDYFEALKRKD
jgi:hypothetical protein